LACPTVAEAADQWLAEQIHATHRQAFQIDGYLQRALLPGVGSRRGGVRQIPASPILP